MFSLFETVLHKARLHCEIFLSDYFMKHSLMHISLHFDFMKFIKIYEDVKGFTTDAILLTASSWFCTI